MIIKGLNAEEKAAVINILFDWQIPIVVDDETGFLIADKSNEKNFVSEEKADYKEGIYAQQKQNETGTSIGTIGQNLDRSNIVADSKKQLPRNANIPGYLLEPQSKSIKAYFVEDGKDLALRDARRLFTSMTGVKLSCSFGRTILYFLYTCFQKRKYLCDLFGTSTI